MLMLVPMNKSRLTSGGFKVTACANSAVSKLCSGPLVALSGLTSRCCRLVRAGHKGSGNSTSRHSSIVLPSVLPHSAILDNREAVTQSTSDAIL